MCMYLMFYTVMVSSTCFLLTATVPKKATAHVTCDNTHLDAKRLRGYREHIHHY